MFCKTCGSLLVPKHTPFGKWFSCPNGHLQPELQNEEKTLTSQNQEKGREIQVAKDENILAVHKHKCKRCGYEQAELIEIAPSYSDEDPTYRMKCGKCGFVEQLEGKVK